MGELRVRESLHEIAQLRVGQFGQRTSGRAGRVACGRGHVCVLHRILRVGMHDVPYLVPDHAHQLPVVHQIHQRTEYAHASVPAGERVDVGHFVNFEVQFQSVDFDILGQPLEPLAVGRSVGRHGIVVIHPFDRLAAEGRYVGIGKRDGFYHVGARLDEFLRVQRFTAQLDLGLCLRRAERADGQRQHCHLLDHGLLLRFGYFLFGDRTFPRPYPE